jgi:hypothetical protein
MEVEEDTGDAYSLMKGTRFSAGWNLYIYIYLLHICLCYLKINKGLCSTLFLTARTAIDLKSQFMSIVVVTKGML